MADVYLNNGKAWFVEDYDDSQFDKTLNEQDLTGEVVLILLLVNKTAWISVFHTPELHLDMHLLQLYRKVLLSQEIVSRQITMT